MALLELQDNESEASVVRFSLKSDGALWMKIQHSSPSNSATDTEVQRLAWIALEAVVSQYKAYDFESFLLNGKEVLAKALTK